MGRSHQLALVLSAASATASLCLQCLLVVENEARMIVIVMTGCDGCVLKFLGFFFSVLCTV